MQYQTASDTKREFVLEIGPVHNFPWHRQINQNCQTASSVIEKLRANERLVVLLENWVEEMANHKNQEYSTELNDASGECESNVSKSRPMTS